MYTVKVITALGLAQLQMHNYQFLLSTPTDVCVGVTSSRIDKSSWNMHQIKVEWCLFHIMYVSRLYVLGNMTHFVKVRHCSNVQRPIKHSIDVK